MRCGREMLVRDVLHPLEIRRIKIFRSYIQVTVSAFFANTSYRMRMDVGDAVQDYLSVEALGDVFDFYIWSGTPREAMTAYGTLTGLPIFPPEWVFEPWAGGGGGRWRNGPLQDIALEQMAAIEKIP